MIRDWLIEAGRVLSVVPGVEFGRITEGPAPLVRRLRSEGRGRRQRTPVERSRLQRVIRCIDACLPDRGNCYRRSLLEVALDRGAAEEPFFMGLSAGGGAKSGHAWLGSSANLDRRYDAIIAI